MSVAVDLSTAGIHVGYGFESASGTKPTVFTDLPNPKSLADMNPEPSTYDTTSLNATEWKTYMAGLKDPGGALAIKFGMSQVLKDLWKELCDTYKTSIESGKRLWMEFYHPKLDEGFFFTCEPIDMGWAAADVDQQWEVEVKVIPTGEIGWDAAITPTEATD